MCSSLEGCEAGVRQGEEYFLGAVLGAWGGDAGGEGAEGLGAAAVAMHPTLKPIRTAVQTLVTRRVLRNLPPL